MTIDSDMAGDVLDEFLGQTLTLGHEIIHFVEVKSEDVPLFIDA